MGDILTRVLYGTALRGPCELEYAHAVRLAEATGADLHTVHVLAKGRRPDWSALPRAPWAEGLTEYRHEVEGEDPVAGLVRAVIRYKPDMLVLGTGQRQGLERLRRGSVAEKLTSQAGLVTLFTGASTTPVVHPIDGSVSLRRAVIPVSRDLDNQQRALDVLAYLTRSLGIEELHVVLLFCGPRSEFPTLTRPDDSWIIHRETSREAVVAATLNKAVAHHADLVVMATRGSDTVADHMFGSRTEHVVRQSPCPVLAVPV